MAFLVEGRPRQPFLRAPAVVVWLIAALVGAHVLRVLVFFRQSEALFLAYGFVPGPRTLFIQNPEMDLAAGTGAIEVK